MYVVGGRRCKTRFPGRRAWKNVRPQRVARKACLKFKAKLQSAGKHKTSGGKSLKTCGPVEKRAVRRPACEANMHQARKHVAWPAHAGKRDAWPVCVNICVTYLACSRKYVLCAILV